MGSLVVLVCLRVDETLHSHTASVKCDIASVWQHFLGWLNGFEQLRCEWDVSDTVMIKGFPLALPWSSCT